MLHERARKHKIDHNAKHCQTILKTFQNKIIFDFMLTNLSIYNIK